MHAIVTDIVAAGSVVGAVALLAYRAGIAVCSRRISHQLKSDRDFGMAVLEDLAGRWGVKIEHQETPGGT